MDWKVNPHIVRGLTREDFAAAVIWEAARQEERAELVIIANRGVHAIDEGKFGDAEVIYATEGNLGGSPFNQDDLNAEIIAVIKYIAAILKARRYGKVSVVPTGLPLVSLAIQAVITQITSKAPVVLQYDRESGEYWEMAFEYRKIIADTSTT